MKKKRHRKGRGKNKPVSNEALYLAWTINMISFVRELQFEPSELRELIHILEREDEFKTKLWEFAVAGKSLSKIDSALAKIRRRGEWRTPDKLVLTAWDNLHFPSGYDPTYDEIIAEVCRITGKERTDSIASAVRRSIRRLRIRITLIRKSELKNTK